MMHPATIEICEHLRKKTQLKVFTEEMGENSAVWLKVDLKNGGSYRIHFISHSEQNDVAVRVISLIRVDRMQIPGLLPVLNALNRRFRFVKFVLDDRGQVHLEYDFTLNTASVADSAEEIIVRIVRIIDEAYPEMMKALGK